MLYPFKPTRIAGLAGMFYLVAALPGQAMSFEKLDANSDGMITYGEMLVSVPSLTEQAFVAIDTSGDQLIDAEELSAAIEAGILMPSDG